MLLRYLLIRTYLKKGLKTRILYRFLIISFLVLCANIVSAQKTAMIMEALVTDDGKKMSGAVVEVFRNGKFVEKVLTDGKGRADIAMSAGFVYTITISGNGMITKKIEVDTKSTPTDLSEPLYYPAEVDIFNKVDGIDYSILNQPIGKIAFNPELGDFSADESHTKKVQSALKKMTQDYMAKKAQALAAAKGNKKLYDAAIKIADKAFAEEKWEEAEVDYKKAAEYMPLEMHPQFQLAELKTKLIEIRKLNAKYDQAIKAAEAAEKAKDFAAAISEYKRASGYKPNEAYPSDKVKALQTTLANAGKVEQDYLAAIERGDNALKINELTTAKAAFVEASGLKPDETYPKNKLAEINDILGKEKAKEEEYNAAIKAADAALTAKDFEKAKSEYTKASATKPTEKYPKDQIAKVNGLLAESAKRDQNYLAAIEQGDNALAANKFEEAKTAFTNASSIKPAEDYPKNKIKEIADYLAKNAEKEKAYQENITAADKALVAENYDESKAKYMEASKLKPTEAYPKDKIREIEGLVTANAEKEGKYTAAIAAGDQAIGSENYDAAKSAFNNALAIKPGEKYPQDKLAEIEGIVVGMQQQEEKYNSAIKAGDDALAAEKMEDAKKAYLEASGLKPTESYPQDKLAEIDKIIAANAEKESSYASAITEGDAAFKLEDWDKASVAYSKALSVKSAEIYPQNQLGIIDEKKAALAAESEAAAKLDADYLAAIKNGDDALSNSDYATAKTAYEAAVDIKSNEQYPKDKIKEVVAILAANAEKDADYQKAISAGDQAINSKDYATATTQFESAVSLKPEESYPKEQLAAIETKMKQLAEANAASAKLDADYQAAITAGDSKLNAKEYDAAISSFTQASELKPEESYPTGKISEIKGIQDKLAAEAAEIEKQAELQKQYDDLISKADKSFGSGDLESARTDFQAALTLKADESYPKTKIDEINSSLSDAAEQDKAYQDAIVAADQALGSADFENAKAKYTEAASIKSGEQYPKDKLAEIETKLAEIAAKQEEIRIASAQSAELDANYNAAVEEANLAFNSMDFDAAESAYTKALSIKPAETYPQTQLAAIDTKRLELKGKEEQEAAAAAKAEIDASYNALVKEADGLYSAADYDNAISKYSKALELKDEQYPKDQLKAIDGKLDKMAKDADQAKIDAAFQAIVDQGDALFEGNDLENAKTKYQEALVVKEDQYAKDQIAEIESRILEQASAAEQASANAAAAELDAKYQAAITEADNAFNAENFDAAETNYIKALGFKPAETYPQSQLGIIDSKREEAASLAAQASANAEKEKTSAELNANYQAAITEGDAALNANDFDTAEKAYMKALSFKPQEVYPQTQLGNIDARKEEISLKQEQADIEKAEATRLAKLELDYIATIEKADNQLTSRDLSGARASYENASLIKPAEDYPKNKIAEIDGMIAAQKAASEASLAELNQKYQEAIALADNAFSSRAWKEAISRYNEAQSFKTNEPYPAQKVEEINQILAKKKSEEEERKLARERAAANESSYQTAIVEGDNAFNSGDYKNAKSRYRLAQDIKPDEEYPQNKLREIQSMLDAESAAKAEAERAKAQKLDDEKQYASLISSGDASFENNIFTSAKSDYSAAIRLKPSELYPKQQLAKVEAELEKLRQAKLEELRKADEPIQIQKGPRSTITDNAEAEIDRIYKEMWSKKNSDKNDKLVEVQTNYFDINTGIKEKEEERRKKALEEIEGIAVSMQLSNEGSEDIYIQNYEEVIEKEKAVKTKTEELTRGAERNREEAYSEEKELAENILDFATEKNKENVEGKKDMVEDQMTDRKETIEKYTADQAARIAEAKGLNAEQEQKIREYFKSIAEKNGEEQSAYFDTENEKWLATNKKYASDGDQNLDEATQKIYQKRDDLRAYDKYMAENQGINEYQQKINDQQIDVLQFNQERKDNFKENQEKIEEQVVVLKTESERLEEEAEKKRQANSELEFYQGEDKPRQDRMAENYPQGVTEEIIENQNSSTTIRRIVVEGTEVDIFEKTLYSWGGVFYTLNGDNITKDIWDENSK